MESGSDENDVTPELMDTKEEITSPNVIPEHSKKKYELAYKYFMDWREKKQINSFSDRVLMAYFVELSKKYKASTLWTYYSMLRSSLNIYHKVKIEYNQKLRSFLKRKAENYQPKKARTLSLEQINKFIIEAPDLKYLATKVALIMGVMGACRSIELYAMQIEDLQDLNTAYFVTIRNRNSKITRRFTITNDFYKICKKYADLRPAHLTSSTFFINYQNGKCTVQRIGINKFGAMAKEVAKYLKLSNPELYTGHCFHRSSASLLVDGGGDITDLKRHHKGLKHSSISKGYNTDKSLSNNNCIKKELLRQVNPSSTITSNQGQEKPNKPQNNISFDKHEYRVPSTEEEAVQNQTKQKLLETNNAEPSDGGDSESNSTGEINFRNYNKKPPVYGTDEDVNFVLSLVPTLKSLSEVKKLDAKIKILSVLRTFKLEQNHEFVSTLQVQVTPEGTSSTSLDLKNDIKIEEHSVNSDVDQ